MVTGRICPSTKAEPLPRKPTAPPKAKRRVLGPTEAAASVGILDTWPEGERLTWDALVSRIEQHCGHRWTRQTLESHPDIKAAYLRRRDAAARPKTGRQADPAEVVHQRQVESLKAEVSALKRRLAAYEEMFVRHHYNAERRGVTVADLERELPKTDKGQTDGGRFRQVR